MFIVSRGEAVVTIEPAIAKSPAFRPGGFFGEMSLLTGDPRNATVRTTVDSELLEIAVEPFRRFVLANPTAVEQIGEAVARRQAELQQHRAAAAGARGSGTAAASSRSHPALHAPFFTVNLRKLRTAGEISHGGVAVSPPRGADRRVAGTAHTCSGFSPRRQ